MSQPTDASRRPPESGPAQDVHAHFELALAALDRLREVLPPPNRTRTPDGEGGNSA